MRYRSLLSPALWLAPLVLLLGTIEPAHASNILDQVGQTYQTAAGTWESSLYSIAKGLFIKLALLEILWFAIWWTIERDDPSQFLAALLRKIMALLFFWAILLNFDTWIPAIINGFVQAGQTAAGTGALTPSTVLDRGLQLATQIISTSNNIGLLDGISGLGAYLTAAIAALGILLAFGVIAGQLLVTLIESYIVVNAGVLFLGFAGSRWTTTFAEKFLSYSVSVGVKLFVTYLIIGAGQNISNNWASTINANMQVADYLTILVGALVYMFLAWQIPSFASSMLTGSVSMTLGSAMATAGTMAAGALGAAGAATAAASGAVNGVAGAVKAGNAAIGQAKEKGASGLAGIAGGAAMALGSGVAEAARDGIKGLGANSAGGGLANRIDNKTAGIREANAASSVSAATVPGAQPAAPAATATGAAAPASTSAAASGGAATRATPAAPAATPSAGTATPSAPAASSTLDLSGDIGAALAARNAGSAPSAPAAPAPGRFAPPASPASSSTGSASTPTPASTSATPAPASTPAAQPAGASTSAPAPASSAAPASSSTAATPAGPQPQAPQKDGVFQTLAGHAEALGNVPNDSAAGAGVQINLKHD